MLSLLYIGFSYISLSHSHCVEPGFFPVNGVTLPQHGGLWLGPVGVFCVLYSSWPHLLCSLLLLLLLFFFFFFSLWKLLWDGSALQTQGQTKAKLISPGQSRSEWQRVKRGVCFQIVLFASDDDFFWDTVRLIASAFRPDFKGHQFATELILCKCSRCIIADF